MLVVYPDPYERPNLPPRTEEELYLDPPNPEKDPLAEPEAPPAAPAPDPQ